MRMFKRKKREKRESQFFSQIKEAYNVTKSVKPWIGAALVGIFLVGLLLVTLIVNAIFKNVAYSIFVSIPAALLIVMLIFTRIAGGN